MSEATMKRDFERLALERLDTFVSDMIDLFEMVDLEQSDAAKTLMLALLTTMVKVIAWSGPIPSRDEMANLVEVMMKAATYTKQRAEERARKGNVQ